MVMVLPRPAVDSLMLVDEVVAERQNGVNAAFFNGMHAEWRQRVEAFIAAAGSPSAVPRWRTIEPNKNSLLNLYLSPLVGSAHKEMLDGLKDHGLNLCPACGEAGKPNTLDHYLPKSLYPHFCVTPLNLFPMCDACQRQKLDKTGSAAEPRFFLHPYFDVFVAERVLEIAISPPFASPTFVISPTSGLSQAQSALVASHIRELGISARYAHFFKEMHIRLLKLCNRMRSTGQDVERSLGDFELNASFIAPNSWENVFYTAVCSNAELMSYLTTADLPLLI